MADNTHGGGYVPSNAFLPDLLQVTAQAMDGYVMAAATTSTGNLYFMPVSIASLMPAVTQLGT
jgi:hypothetical protein